MFKNNVEIVVSRYNEDLSWLNEYPFNKQAVVEAINEFNKLYLIAKPE